MTDSSHENGAAVLLGRLIRSYRDDVRRNGRRLSQDGLLNLMVERGEEYAVGLDRSSISHWERGARLAPREFLVAFGRALNIPKGEMDTMLEFAGYQSVGEQERREEILTAARRLESQVERLQQDIQDIAHSAGASAPPVDTAAVVKSAAWKMTPPGIYALIVGFVLNALDQNGTLALLAYVLVAFAIVLGQGVLRWVRPGRNLTERDHVVDLFFISLFFTLNTTLLIGSLTKADHFGFYTFEAFRNTPMPFLFTMLVNIALSLVASVMFSLLWSRRHASAGERNAFFHAVWTTLPPLLFVYANLFVFTNLGAWMFFLVIFGILFGAFTIIVALNEPGFSLADGDFVFKAAIVTIVILSSFGIAGMGVTYLEPDIQITAAYFRVIPLPEVSPTELGYSDEQGVNLLRLGTVWMSLATIVYLVTVVGGYLIVTIRRAAA